MRKKKYMAMLLTAVMLLGTACGKSEDVVSIAPEPILEPSVLEAGAAENENMTEEKKEEKKVNYAKLFASIERKDSYKNLLYNNPLITQEYGADPYALVYDDTLYIYMTQDEYMYEADKSIKENNYSNIKSIRVISTKDMVNWTDCGDVHVAYSAVGAKWAKNSWAPAVAWKNIDGKDQFFLYFADGGGGIGVLRGDSPLGPFEDPIGKGLIRRDMPNCGNVLWLFDPAVLVDDDGRAYLYFGGGVPEGQAEHPHTGRCVELGDDMISIKGEPVEIDAPYLFEDSGIHKFNNKYYYTYCNNWTGEENRKNYGFGIADIAMMESDSPLGPFTYKEVILDNPNKPFGISSNNHHCVFNFRNQWYITYHTRTLERDMGVEKGYRSTFINKVNIKEDGSIGHIKMNYDGAEQSGYVNPYEVINATTFSHQAGLTTAPANVEAKKYGSGTQLLTGIDDGDYFRVKGVDFKFKEADKLTVTLRKSAEVDENCAIEVRSKSFRGDVLCYIPVGELLADENIFDEFEFKSYTIDLKTAPKEVTDLYFTFAGSGYQLLDWQFSGTESNWYESMVDDSLTSVGNNGRLQKVWAKLAAGDTVNVAFIGGSITEGAGAAKLTESYADRVAAKLSAEFPKAKINYVNAGLGGTPSALGVMRYNRDVVEKIDGDIDLLFIEFSVNDYQEATDGRAFESLIKEAMLSSENTAVALVYSVFKSKWNMQDNYIPMGELYGLPMVSVKDGTKEAFEAGKLTDEEYFSDEFHPTSYGHEIMADCVWNMLTKAAAEPIEAIAPIPEKEVKGADFMGMKLISSSDTRVAKIKAGGFSDKDTESHIYMRGGHITFPENWKHTAGSDGADFEMEINCAHLLINYKKNGNADKAGAVDVYVDGGLVKTIESFENGGWNQSCADLIIDGKEAAAHKVELKLKDSAKDFTVFAFAYN